MLKVLKHIALACCLVLLCQTAWAKTKLAYDIKGLEGPALDNVLARLTSAEKPFEGQLTETNIRRLYEQAPKNIRAAMKPFGYFKPFMESELKHKNNTWTAKFKISRGPKMHITKLDVQVKGPGINDEEVQRLLKDFPIKEDQALLTENYNQAKESLFQVLEKEGYLDVSWIKHVILVDLINYQSTIQLHIDTGPRYFFGAVQFSENPYSIKYLNRFIPFDTGAPYSTTDLLEFQNALTGSGNFTQVSIHPKKDDEKNKQVPVDVQLTPRKSQQYTIGAGYGTDTKIRGKIGWEWRRLNNMAHRFLAKITASSMRSSALARYIIPGKNPVTDQYNLTASAFTNRLSQGNSHTLKLEGGYITAYGDWQQTLSLSYQTESFDFQGKPSENTNLLMPSATWLKVASDDLIFPTNGTRISFNIKGATQHIVSDTSFIQADLKGKHIRELYSHGRVIVRGDIGYTAVRHLDELPLSLRFYAGGTNSVRGFGYNNLGPGRYLLEGSVEYQQRIYGNFYIPVFFDMGNAFNHYSQLTLERSVGTGIMWASPVGPLELTFAHTLSRDDNSIRVEFKMGPDL